MKTFIDLWNKLEPKARSLGLKDGDVPRAQGLLKAHLSNANWLKGEELAFISDRDRNNCLSASADEIDRVVLKVTRERTTNNATALSAGFTPTKNQVLGGVTFSPTAESVSHQMPTLLSASAEAVCAKCGGKMRPIELVNDLKAVMCEPDRIVTPVL